MKDQHYYVYVIELDKKVLKDKRFRAKNPDYIEGKPCVYVGQSAQKPEVRFNQHLDGYKSNRYARYYGRKIRLKDCEELNPIASREAAERLEKELSERFRREGYAVWSN